MGCDIHMYAEVKKDSKWEKVGKVFKNPYYDKTRPSTTAEDGYEWNAKLIDNPYKKRNYSLFAILADVRNGFGCAGCDLGDGFNPIDDPRGLPKDVSREIKKESDSWDCDGHSHSYFTLKELLDYDWDQKSKIRGWVYENGFLEWQEKGRPSNYCGGVEGKNVEHITWQEMKRKIMDKSNKFTKLMGREYVCNVEWEESYRECANSFLTETIPQLKRLGNPENVRIVFWFDN